MKQMTLKGSFSLCGKGLHTGLSLTVTFNPAPENTAGPPDKHRVLKRTGSQGVVELWHYSMNCFRS